MRFMPPVIPPQEEWSSTKLASAANNPRAANTYCHLRRSSVSTPSPLLVRRPSQYHQHVIRKPLPIKRRRTVDVKVPGAFVEYRLSRECEQMLEEHAKKIEAEFATIAENQQKTKAPVRLPSRPSEELYSPSSIDSSSRYRDQQPPIDEFHVAPLHIQKVNNAGKNTKVDSNYHLKKLSLGDISSGLGVLY